MADIDSATLSARPPANARVPLVFADKSIGAMLASAGGDPWMLGAVRVATTTNGTLATAYENGDTVDGVTLATGDRILLKNQSSGAENGIYTVNASGAPTRATDADGAGELYQGLKVYVLEGTTNARTTWKLTTSGTITIGSTSQTWEAVASIAGLKGADIASAATVDLSAATGDFVDITGTTTVTSLGTVAAGAEFTLRFTGALQITHNGTSLILPNAENFITVAGDVLTFRSLGSGNWVCVGVRRAAVKFDIPFEVMSDVSDTYRLKVKTSFPYIVTGATYRTTASTVTAAVQIDGVNVTSLSGLSATTSEQSASASGANTAAVDTDLTLVTSSPGTSGSRLYGAVHCTRA